jgi:SAM-dependent methyltransferase
VKDESANLVTIAQAMHWLDQDDVFAEVKRVLVPGGSIGIWGYPRCVIKNNDNADRLFKTYHFETMKPWWDERRWLLDDYYKHLHMEAFFDDVQRHVITDYTVELSLTNFVNYMQTQSCRLAFLDSLDTLPTKQDDPLQRLADELANSVVERDDDDEPLLQVNFPMILFVARKSKT